VSATATPSGLSLPGSSDFGDLAYEEEDRKPNVEYLDSLNDYRKRSRSTEDVGGSAKNKMAKVHVGGLTVNGLGNGNGFGHSQETAVGTGSGIDIDAVSMPPESQEVPEDDPVVYGKFHSFFHVVTD
jgi:transcription initiation factor TFIIE subunit alpha